MEHDSLPPGNPVLCRPQTRSRVALEKASKPQENSVVHHDLYQQRMHRKRCTLCNHPLESMSALSWSLGSIITGQMLEPIDSHQLFILHWRYHHFTSTKDKDVLT